MSDLYAVARRQPKLSGENGEISLWANRAGSQVFVPENQQLIAAGYGYHVTVGALTTPITGGGAGTILDTTEPELAISVPSGTAIRPVRFHVQCEVPADQDGDVQEAVIIVDRTAALTSGGTSTTEVAFNMRTDNPFSTNCAVYSAVTVDIAPAMTQSFELCRKQMVTNIVTSGITHGYFDMLYEPKYAPILVGPCAIFVLFGGTQAMAGFIQAEWVEMPASLNALFGGS